MHSVQKSACMLIVFGFCCLKFFFLHSKVIVCNIFFSSSIILIIFSTYFPFLFYCPSPPLFLVSFEDTFCLCLLAALEISKFMLRSLLLISYTLCCFLFFSMFCLPFGVVFLFCHLLCWPAVILLSHF